MVSKSKARNSMIESNHVDFIMATTAPPSNRNIDKKKVQTQQKKRDEYRMALFCIRKYHILCIAKGVRPNSIFRKWKMKSLCDIQKPCEREEISQRKDQLLSGNMYANVVALLYF